MHWRADHVEWTGSHIEDAVKAVAGKMLFEAYSQ